MSLFFNKVITKIKEKMLGKKKKSFTIHKLYRKGRKFSIYIFSVFQNVQVEDVLFLIIIKNKYLPNKGFGSTFRVIYS